MAQYKFTSDFLARETFFGMRGITAPTQKQFKAGEIVEIKEGLDFGSNKIIYAEIEGRNYDLGSAPIEKVSSTQQVISAPLNAIKSNKKTIIIIVVIVIVGFLAYKYFKK